MRKAFSLLIPALILACSSGDALRIARIAASGDVGSAQRMAAEKAARYAVNPQALARDIRVFNANFKRLTQAFRKAVIRVWGHQEAKEPQPKEYVKYTDN